MRCRDPQRIIELNNWLWRRAIYSECPPFRKLQPQTLTGRCIVLIVPQMIRIEEAMNSREYREAVTKIVHSN